MRDGVRPRAHRKTITAIGAASPRRVRLALLVLGLGLLPAALTGAAQAASGGISSSSGGASPGGPGIPFGSRVLKVGMSGTDVAVLNGIVKSKAYGSSVRFDGEFRDPTAAAVREFQRRIDLRPSGVVTRVTAKELAGSMPHSGATWYGPGFYGSRTACGQVLRAGTVGVAHKTLPCGTKVTFYYHGRSAIATVIDRGPYTKGNSWDLTNGLRRLLRFGGSDQIRYAVAR